MKFNSSLSFRDWPYPSRKKFQINCAWSECDLFAYSISNSLTILTNDQGKYTPIMMISPFTSEITCLEWMNGSLSDTIASPILGVCNSKGKLEFLNIATGSTVGSTVWKSDTILSLKFSRTKPYEFYVGLESGLFVNAKLPDEKRENLKLITKYQIKHPINFIAFDKIFESSIAVASENGYISVIENGKIKIDNFSIGEKIISLDFYCENENYLMLTTPRRSILFSINHSFIISFLQKVDIRDIYVIEDNLVVIEKDSVTLYRVKNKLEWKQYSEITFPNLKIHKSVCCNDEIMLILYPLQLYRVKIHKNKLLVTHYCPLLNSRPTDWDLLNGSIAITTSSGKLHITPPNESAQYGNPMHFSLTFSISDPMQIKWINEKSLILWSRLKRRIAIVDIDKKTITNLAPFKYLKDNDTIISQIFISPDRNHVCIVLNKQTAIIFRSQNMELVCMISLIEIAIGTFHSDSRSIIFIGFSHHLYIYDINGKLLSTQEFPKGLNNFPDNSPLPEPTAIMCNERGHVFVGDSLGEVFKFKKDFTSPKLIFPFKSDSVPTTAENEKDEGSIGLSTLANLFPFSKPSSPPKSAEPKSGLSSPIQSTENATSSQPNKTKSPSKVREIDSFGKSKGIWRLSALGKILFILTRSNQGFAIKNEGTIEASYQKLPYPIKHYQPANNQTIIVMFPKNKKLISYPLTGKIQLRKSASWYRCSLLYEEVRITYVFKSISDFSAFGLPFLSKVFRKVHKSMKKETEIIITVLQNLHKMSDIIYPMALLTGNHHICKNILSKVNSKSPNFLLSITTLALFDLEKPGSAVNRAIEIFKENQCYQHCYDFMMATKSYKKLLDTMVERNDIKQAYTYIRNQDLSVEDMKSIEDSVIKLVDRMHSDGFIVPPLILMAQLGLYNEMCVYITKLSLDNPTKKAIIKFIQFYFIDNETHQ